jgi:hypothetical protein
MEFTIGIYAIIFISFFLIIPGSLARRFYYNGEFSKQINLSSSSSINLVYSLFVGIILSLSFVAIFNSVSDVGINIDSVLNRFDANFVSQQDKPKAIGKFDGLSDNILKVYLPFIGGMYFFSAMIGFFLSKFVVFFGWDTRWKFFRFGNNWHYLFSGKILKFKKYTSSNVDHNLKVKYTYLDVLVSGKGDETTLYSGLFADYDINRQDISKLEKIHLLKATRYKKDGNATLIRNIPGNLFTIMGDRILNINCTYICFDEEESRNKSFVFQKNIFIPVSIVSTLFFLTILISFLFSLNLFNSVWYQKILSESIFTKTILLFFLNIVMGLFTPFEIKNEEKKVKFIGAKAYLYKIILIFIMLVILNFVCDFSLL